MAYQIDYKSGVMQDHKGRCFRLAHYPNGKQIIVPYVEVDAPPARMIPVPKPAEALDRRDKIPTYTGSDGVKRNIVHLPKRVGVLKSRRVGGKIETAEALDRGTFEDLIGQIKPLMRSPDCGKTWVPAEPVTHDWHVCYHLDQELPHAQANTK